MRASKDSNDPSYNEPRQLPFNLFGMPKFNLYLKVREDKEPRKEITSIAANRLFI